MRKGTRRRISAGARRSNGATASIRGCTKWGRPRRSGRRTSTRCTRRAWKRWEGGGGGGGGGGEWGEGDAGGDVRREGGGGLERRVRDGRRKREARGRVHPLGAAAAGGHPQPAPRVR